MKNLSLGFVTLLLMFSFTSCKKQKIIEGVGVSTEQLNGNKLVRAEFDFGFKEITFPSFYWDLPKNWGSIEIGNAAGQNKIILDVDVTEILKLPPGEARLPNGTPIPLIIRSAGEVVFIDIPKIHGRIYVSHKNGETMVGFAISIKGLDGVGDAVGNLDIFPEFNFKKVRGVAGVFSSVEPGETGLGAFVVFGDSNTYGLPESIGNLEFAPARKLTFKQKRNLRKALKAIRERNLGRELELY